MKKRHMVCSLSQFKFAVTAVVMGLLLFLASYSLAQEKKVTRYANIISPEEFKQQLEGPIVVIPTPFTSDNRIDYEGVRRMIHRALRYKAKVFALTAGDSQYDHISYDEAKELTRVMVETVSNEGVTIASTGMWNKAQVLDYCRYAEAVGASAIQALMPQKVQNDKVIEFYRDIARTTRLAIVLYGNFSEELLDELIKIDSVVAMKEDIGLKYLIDRQIVYGDRLNIFPGGAESRFLVSYPYGARAYFSAIYQFAPKLGLQFWKSIKAGNVKETGEFVKKYDFPYMRNWSHAFWVATMEYFGVSQRYCRPPEKSFTDEQMKDVKKFWDELGVIPEEYK